MKPVDMNINFKDNTVSVFCKTIDIVMTKGDLYTVPMTVPCQKITHMWKRWGTPQNLFLAFTDELEKQIIIKKTVEVGQ